MWLSVSFSIPQLYKWINKMFSLFKRKKKVLESASKISIRRLNSLQLPKNLTILGMGMKPFMSREFLISPVNDIDEFIELLDRSLSVVSNPSRTDFKIIILEDRKIYYSSFINIKDYKNLHNHIKELIDKSILFLENYENLESKLDKTMEEERTIRVYRYLFSHICSISEQLENIIVNSI